MESGDSSCHGYALVSAVTIQTFPEKVWGRIAQEMAPYIRHR